MTGNVLKGVGASPGIVIGKAFHVQRARAEVVYQKIIDPAQVAQQLKRLDQAVAKVEIDLLAVREKVREELPAQVYLIDAHLMILKDKMFHDQARRIVESQMVNSEWAVVSAVRQIARRFSAIEDAYIRSRIEDVEWVAERVLKALAGQADADFGNLRQKAILVARDLSPADTTQLDVRRVMGFVTAMGSRTSHTAIVAQALEIPAVVGLEEALAQIPAGSLIIVDGNMGQVIVNPDEDTLADYELRQTRYAEYVDQAQKAAHLPAVTVDGQPVSVMANIEQPDEAEAALRYGAEGIGLFRTEFLYLNQAELPDEETLHAHYRRVVATMAGRPVTIRTLDLGGDKFSHEIAVVPEMNPAMGLRGVRFCLRRPDIFKTQLRAILRSSAHGKLRVMFPMISGIQEIKSCREILDQCAKELKAEGRPFDARLKVGCMIEVPSAVAIADLLARYVDFFSIGTNDLIQYSLAIDRGNEYVAHMYQPFHPAALRMIKQTIDIGRRAGLPVALCGEMGGEPAAVPLLLGLGLDTISVNPQAVSRIKQLCRVSSWSACQKIAQRALDLETETEVGEFIHRELGRLYPESFDAQGRLVY